MLYRNIIIILLLSFSVSIVEGQNFLRTEEAANAKNWKQAYTELMKLKSKDRKERLFQKVDGNYWFGYVLSQSGIGGVDLDATDILKDDYVMTGFDYLKKAYELDKHFSRFIIGQPSPYKQFFDIYVFYYEKGIRAHNKQKYEDAVTFYERAMRVGSFLSSNQMGVPVLDTNLVYYATLSYVNTKRTEKADAYIEELVKAGAKKKEAIDLLKWQMNRALNDDNKVQYDKVKKMGIQYYPEYIESLWNLYDVEYALSLAETYEDKIKVYEKTLLTDKVKDGRHAYNYVVEIYKHSSSKSVLAALSDDKAEEMFSNLQQISNLAYELNKESYEPFYLYQKLLYLYVSVKNDEIGELKKQLREKATPVKGIAPKGSALEKELNRLKKTISSQRGEIKMWAEKDLLVSEKLVTHFQGLPSLDKKQSRTYGDILDIASGLAYLAGEGAKSDQYDKMRTTITKTR